MNDFTELTYLRKMVEEHDTEIKKLQQELQEEKEAAQKREVARLKWGIGALGTVTMMLFGVLLGLFQDVVGAFRK